MAFNEYANFFSGAPSRAQAAQRAATENRAARYDLDQRIGLDAEFAASLDERGVPVMSKFLQGAQARGLGVDAVNKYLASKQGMFKLASENALEQQVIRSSGGDPSKLLPALPVPPAPALANEQLADWLNPSATPAAQVKEAPAVPVSFADPGQKDQYKFITEGAPEAAPAQPEAAARPAVPTDVATPGVDGEVRITGQVSKAPDMGTLPPPPMREDTPKPAVEGWFDEFARNVQPIQADAISGDDTAAAAQRASDITSWAPKNDGTNEYRQFASALQTNLRALGYPDASTYLQQVYTQELQANTPPQPNPALRLLGREGMVKYQSEVAAYQAQLQQARGKAEAKVLEARDNLTKMARQYGVDTVDQRKSELPGGLVLRDQARRGEAAALITNAQNINLSKADLAHAGTDGAKLMLVAPSIIRAYTTALNPGQQLSEGNLKESAMKLFPEFGGSEQLTGKAVLALALYMKDDDRSGIDALMSTVSQSSPIKLRARLERMVDEANKLNNTTLSSYTTGRVRPAQDPSPEPVRAPAPAPATAGDQLSAFLTGAAPVATDSVKAPVAPLKPKPKPGKAAPRVKAPQEYDVRTTAGGMEMYRNGKWTTVK